jgi:hypothetical protein
MFKRIMLSLAFAGAFAAAGLSLTENAEARRWIVRRPAVAVYSGPVGYYSYGVPYRSYYRGVYGPRVYSYPGVYSYPYYGGPGYFYRPGIRVGIGVW